MRIAANREGGNTVIFLQDMLPKRIPALGTSKIQIERAHRIHSPKNDSQTTMIFKVLRYRDRNAILQGARKARKRAPIQDAGRNIRFYANCSTITKERRTVYADVMKELYERGIPVFLNYLATLRNGEQRTYISA